LLPELHQPKVLLSTTLSKVIDILKSFIDNDLTNKWLSRLRMAASTNEARDRLGQLSTLLEFFNKPSNNTGLAPIKWDDWEADLHTSGVVKKIKTKYESFMKAEYGVDAAISQVGN
jgi:hypothetical protein